MADSDKYEVLEKIGHGSFGIIHKVRRKTDGLVRQVHLNVRQNGHADITIDPLPEGDQLQSHVTEGKGTVAIRAFDSQGITAPKHRAVP